MQAPKSWSIFKNIRREPKRFRYQPKHYDAKQDEFEKRMRRVEQRVNGTAAEVEERERANFDFKRSSRRSKGGYRSGLAAANKRLIVILIVLIAMFVGAARWLDNLGG